MKEQEIKIGYIEKTTNDDFEVIMPLSDPVFIEIKETDVGFNLSGRIRSHSYGQIIDSIEDAIRENKFEYLVPQEEIKHLLNYWNEWHLNGKTNLPPPKELKWIREFKKKYEGMELGRRIKINRRSM